MYVDGRHDYFFLVISTLRYSQMYLQPRTPEIEIQFINIVVILLNCTCGRIKSLHFSEILPFPMPCAQIKLTVFAHRKGVKGIDVDTRYVPRFHLSSKINYFCGYSFVNFLCNLANYVIYIQNIDPNFFICKIKFV